MATQDSNRSGDYYDRPVTRTQPGISRSRSTTGARPASGTRSASGSRPASSSRSTSGSRPASGPRPASSSRGYASRQGAPRASGSRPSSGRSGGNRSRRGGKRIQGRFYIFAALAVALIVLLIFVVAKPFGRKDDPAPKPVDNVATNVGAQPDDAQGGGQGTVGGDDLQLPDGMDASQFEQMSALDTESQQQTGSLAVEDMAQVADLSINTSLPEEWINLLLLGTDERTLSESARTDAMIIASINRNTGEVKLTSIMRDLAINFTDIGRYSGINRINSANYFGGAKLAIRTVNECFGLNIQHYVMVNFFGFTKIADRLGGVDADVTKEEMEEINYRIWEQYKLARYEGVDESGIENAWLESYGANTHLNGRQTLAYARLRHFNGGDSIRTERQRIVLNKLLQKAKQLNFLQLYALAQDLFDQVKTDLTVDELMTIANAVLGNGIDNCKMFRLPIVGTYKEERRNDQDMLYDCDFKANEVQLYNFIYG